MTKRVTQDGWGNRHGLPWTEDERNRLYSAVDEFAGDWKSIAALFPGRSRSACYAQYNHYNARPLSTLSPEHHIALRRAAAARQAIGRTDLTAVICGDPAPGRSALDRRGSARGRPITLAPILTGASP